MNEIIFSKYSNERARRFALRTDIMKTDSGRCVRKKALYPEGERHVQHIKECEVALTKNYANTSIRMNRCEYNDQGAWLEYLVGNTLEEKADSMVLEGHCDEAIQFLMEYLEEVKKGFPDSSFTMTDSFREVFGEVDLPIESRSASVVDIDMVLNNVIEKDGWTLIDYEWTFDFPIPYEYVAFRILYYYLHGSSTRNCLLPYDLIRKIGISEEREQLYHSMEKHFQEIYIQRELQNVENQKMETADHDHLHVPIRILYDEMTPGIIKLKELGLGLEDAAEYRKVQLYQASDFGFSEDLQKTYSPQSIDRMSGAFACNYESAKENRYIRLDPAAQFCIVKDLCVKNGSSRLPIHLTNGLEMENGEILFADSDPWMIFEKQNPADSVRVSFHVQYLTAAEAVEHANQQLKKLQSKTMALQGELALKTEQIQQMENTKVWKAYRKLKRD